MKKNKRVPKLLQAMSAKQPKSSTYTERVLSRKEANVQKELDYILQRAAAGHSRVVGFAQLIFFSTHGRDAWMLDWEDELAICLMKDGVARPYQLGETDSRFAIQWQGRYHIEGELFSYIDNETPANLRAIDSYPTQIICKTIERLRRWVQSVKP